jgi:hypothetical protein
MFWILQHWLLIFVSTCKWSQSTRYTQQLLRVQDMSSGIILSIDMLILRLISSSWMFMDDFNLTLWESGPVGAGCAKPFDLPAVTW